MANSFDLCRRAQSATEKVAFCTQAIAEFRRQDVLERAYLRRGNAFVELNDYARAADDFTALIQLNSHTAGYFDNRLHAYRSLGRLSEALNDANTEVRMRPDLAFVYRSRGLVYGDMNRLDLAVADFTRAVSMEPANDTEARYEAHNVGSASDGAKIGDQKAGVRRLPYFDASRRPFGRCPASLAPGNFFLRVSGMRPSRCAFLRASLRERRIASDFSRFLRSDAFSYERCRFISRNTPSRCIFFFKTRRA